MYMVNSHTHSLLIYPCHRCTITLPRRFKDPPLIVITVDPPTQIAQNRAAMLPPTLCKMWNLLRTLVFHLAQLSVSTIMYTSTQRIALLPDVELIPEVLQPMTNNRFPNIFTYAFPVFIISHDGSSKPRFDERKQWMTVNPMEWREKVRASPASQENNQPCDNNPLQWQKETNPEK